MARRSSRLAQAAIPQTPSSATTKLSPKMLALSTTSADSSNTSSSSKKSGIITTDIPTLSFADAQAFRRYMIKAGVTAPGVWLKIGKKSTVIPTVTYDEAVDEALCCGWIDGQRRALDARFFLQRFTPRRRTSTWSRRNVDKVAALVAAKAAGMLPAGLAEVDAAKADGRWERAYAGSSTMEVPADFRALLDARPRAASVFDGMSKAARYPFLHRLQTVKKEETRTRKMAEFVELLDRGDTL
ncbi:hypothetical protein MY10362_007623 [Beauveria mimosiformis]